MTKLIVVATLVGALAFPLLSRAEVSEFGVSVPVEQTPVSDNIRGGSVAEFPYYPIQSQRLNNRSGITHPVSAEYENVYTVFGVRLSGSDVI
jgi:hypothetical protein